jgi:hypothetical protein
MTAEPEPEHGATLPQQPSDRFERFAVALASLASALLAIVSLSLGALGTIGLPLVGIPIVRVAHRKGLGSGLLATILAACLLTGASLLEGSARDLASPVVLMGLMAGLPTFFSGLVQGGADPSREYLALAVSGCALLAAVMMLPPALGARPMGDEVAAAFDAMIPGAIASYSKANVDPETVARVKGTLEAIRDFSRRYWLGLVGAFWILCSAVTFFAGARSARPAASAERTRFEALTLPAFLAPVFVAAGAVFALAPGTARQTAGDVLIPLVALYFVAGLSIICHFARKWLKARLLRIGLYALVIYFPMSVGVALLGLFDWYAGFRRRGEKA